MRARDVALMREGLALDSVVLSSPSSNNNFIQQGREYLSTPNSASFFFEPVITRPSLQGLSSLVDSCAGIFSVTAELFTACSLLFHAGGAGAPRPGTACFARALPPLLFTSTKHLASDNNIRRSKAQDAESLGLFPVGSKLPIDRIDGCWGRVHWTAKNVLRAARASAAAASTASSLRSGARRGINSSAQDASTSTFTNFRCGREGWVLLRNDTTVFWTPAAASNSKAEAAAATMLTGAYWINGHSKATAFLYFFEYSTLFVATCYLIMYASQLHDERGA